MSFEEGSRTSKMMGRVLNFRVGSLVIVGFTILIALLSLGIAAAIGAMFGDAKAVQFGQTGQVFESVAAVFSGLAFIALVVTFLLQLEELKLQRSELGDQKAERPRPPSGCSTSS